MEIPQARGITYKSAIDRGNKTNARSVGDFRLFRVRCWPAGRNIAVEPPVKSQKYYLYLQINQVYAEILSNAVGKQHHFVEASRQLLHHTQTLHFLKKFSITGQQNKTLVLSCWNVCRIQFSYIEMKSASSA